jgi:hypothetical protein
MTTAPAIGKDPNAITTKNCPFGLHKATPHRQIGSWAKSWVETTSRRTVPETAQGGYQRSVQIP